MLLTFAAALSAAPAGEREYVPVRRVNLARGSATCPPPSISLAQVIEHALRHLAWLLTDDPVIAGQLGPAWSRALRGYRPEPFRSFASPTGTQWS